MSQPQQPVQITDLRKLAPRVRQCIAAALNRLIGEAELSYDFYREWNGGWRVRVTIAGRVQGKLDFVLFHTPQGALLAMPIPLPERWRIHEGVMASDTSLWTLSDEGAVVPFLPRA